jgi:hypothetical protein
MRVRIKLKYEAFSAVARAVSRVRLSLSWKANRDTVPLNHVECDALADALLRVSAQLCCLSRDVNPLVRELASSLSRELERAAGKYADVQKAGLLLDEFIGGAR